MKSCEKCLQSFDNKALVCSRCGGALEALPQADPLHWGYSSENAAAARPFLLSDPDMEPIPAGRPISRENVVIRPQRRRERSSIQRKAVRTVVPHSEDEQTADYLVYTAASTENPLHSTAEQEENTNRNQTADNSTRHRTIFGDISPSAPEKSGGGLFGGREERSVTHTRPGSGAGRIFQNLELALRYIIPGAAIIAAIVIIIINWQNIWGAISKFMIFWIPAFVLSLLLFRRNFNMRAGTIIFTTTLLAVIFTILYYNIAGIGNGILSILTPLIPLIIIAGALFFLLRR